MPRDLPIGNGTLLVNFDDQYHLRDLYYPYVGSENHTLGYPCRFGVWVAAEDDDGQFSWVHDEPWVRTLRYLPETLVTDVSLLNPDLGLRLICNDAVDFHQDLYLRRITVHNEHDQARQVRLFFHHDLRISEHDVGDTAYYEPTRRALLHYKERRWFLMCAGRGSLGTTDAPTTELVDFGINQFATGTKGVGGAEGTWRDAENAQLGGNPIAQGSVDSTMGLHLELPAHGKGVVYYWIVVGRKFEEVTAVHRAVRSRGPETYLTRTADYWRLWVNKEQFDYNDLPEHLVDLFKRSLLVLRTQVNDKGAILAATDYDIAQFGRDTYAYMWPRDGALVAYGLDLAGYSGLTQRFFDFCHRVVTKEGFLLHKYNPDESLASSWHPWYEHGERQLPIQEDETGLVVWALWQHYVKFRDVEFIKPLYRGLIVRAADFMVEYRDPETGLPLASYDLWEERRGVLSFTVAAVHGGLTAAASFAKTFGQHDLARRYSQAAADMRRGADIYLWREDEGRFARMINRRADGSWDVDRTVDASLAGLFQFGMYAADDPKIVATMEAVRERLWVKTDVGGVARYENDYYHQVSTDIAEVPGNPWFICTLWLADWYIAKAQNRADLEPALDILRWVARSALTSGVLAEQIHPHSGVPLSVSPLTWSHATYATTVLHYLDRLSEAELCPTCARPLYSREQATAHAEHEHPAEVAAS